MIGQSEGLRTVFNALIAFYETNLTKILIEQFVNF